MFTVELEYDYALIRTLDEQDRYEDVEVIIGEEEEVFMLQFNESTQKNSVIVMSLQQLVDLYAAMDSPEGLFGMGVISGEQ